MPGKMTAVAAEILGNPASSATFQHLIERGWRVHHNQGTAFVSMHHPSGGKFDLLEVKVYGTLLTTGEADLIAAEIATFLTARTST